MSDHPILFSGPMVRAILDGTKTQTRRVVKPQPHAGVRKDVFRGGLEDGHGRKLRKCPYGVPGDVLWVREAHALLPGVAGKDRPVYRADGELGDVRRWRPSIHMPRWASRLTLRVIDVRVEQVQEITDADAVAEGVRRPEDFTPEEADCLHGAEKALFDGMNQPVTVFQRLWDSINAKRGFGWDANPWVWVVSFAPATPENTDTREGT